MQALWPDTFVEEANLSFQISTLRKALGEDGPRWIETVPKHGYRFAGPVGQKEAVAAKPRWYVWVATIAVVAAGGLGFVLMKGHSLREGSTAHTPTPLTAYPGIQAQPNLSPDGSQVAFSWNG